MSICSNTNIIADRFVQRIRIYKAFNLPIDSLDEEIDADFFLSEEIQENDKGNPVWHMLYTHEGTMLSRSRSTYDSKGNCVKLEEFTTEETENPDTVTVLSYNEDNSLHSKSVFFYGELTEETHHRYNSYGKIYEKNIRKISDGEADEIVKVFYRYHITAPDCCIREEYYSNGKNYLNIMREWLVGQLPPFMTEETHERLDIVEQSQTFRFYDPRTSLNNVSEEIYNWKGEFIKESRVLYDGELIARIAWHHSAEAESAETQVEEFVYDVQNRLVSSRYLTSQELLRKQMVYDDQSRISARLTNHKSFGAYEVLLEKWEYEYLQDA